MTGFPLPDAQLAWGGDLILTPSGDIASVDGDQLTQQQIIRRLLTAVQGDVFHLDYGAGLPQRIGRPARERVIQAIVQSQIKLEATVAEVPVPVITVRETTESPGLFVIDIKYTNRISGVAVAISFELPSNR